MFAQSEQRIAPRSTAGTRADACFMSKLPFVHSGGG
jgi:hypothetical protein